MKACVVDDDYTSRVLLKDFLDDDGWNVVSFNHPDSNSIEADTRLVDELKDEATKLLVMDVRFGRDADGLWLGLATVRQLAENAELRNDQIVVFVSQFGKNLTGFRDVEHILNVLGIKNHWMDKPVDYTFLNQYLCDSL
jgi:CheY-like chemotaxis protein